jgi:hypothetical protein
MPADPLEPFLKDAGVHADHVGPDGLGALGKRVTDDPEAFILHFTRAASATSDRELPPGYFEIHDREWWVDARGSDARGHLLTLIAAAAVGEALGLDYSLSWISTVLPATLTVLGTAVDETGVRLALGRRPTPQIPAELADDINPQDFADFVAALREAAEVVPLPAGGTLTFTDG